MTGHSMSVLVPCSCFSFRPSLLSPNGRPSQRLVSSCTNGCTKIGLKKVHRICTEFTKRCAEFASYAPRIFGVFMAQSSNNPRWHIQFSISLEPMTCFSLSFQLQIIIMATKTTGSVILTTYVNSSANLPRRQQLIQIEGCTSTWRSMQTQDVHETLGGTAISPAEVQLQPVKNTVNISNGRTIAMLQISATMTQQ